MSHDIERIVEAYPLLTLQVNVGERHRIMHGEIARGSLWITPKASCFNVAPSGHEVEALMYDFLRNHFGPAARVYAEKWKEWDIDDIGAVASIIRRFASSPFEVPEFVLPEEVSESDSERQFEGSVRRISINSYERHPEARARCIAHFGAKCVVCGFEFGTVYGPLATGHIHVHHLTPLASIGREYEIDPTKDLRPVCANCHSVIHLGGAVRSINEVRALIAEAD